MPPGASLSPPVLPRAFSGARKPRAGAMGGRADSHRGCFLAQTAPR